MAEKRCRGKKKKKREDFFCRCDQHWSQQDSAAGREGPIAALARSCWEPALSQRTGHGEGVRRERRTASFQGREERIWRTMDATRNQASVTHHSRSHVFFRQCRIFFVCKNVYTIFFFPPKVTLFLTMYNF